MNLLIVAATEFEIEPFLQQNPTAEVLITGVGMPATIYHLTKKLLTQKYDLVVQAGIAGTFANHFNLADVVIAKEDTFGDLGIEENGGIKTLFESGFTDRNQFPFSYGWLKNPNPDLNQYSLPLARSVTVNKVSEDNSWNEKVMKKFSAQIESMEGAAFHFVCLQQQVTFLQLRSISNFVGERDNLKWKMKEAIGNLNKELLNIVNNL
ncbi:MAG TPA: futalosine hydrolase [Hanamia sp.]|jgi:futalosine hydrolase|nr:futalosine hydrolase [Hanamia sp.]